MAVQSQRHQFWQKSQGHISFLLVINSNPQFKKYAHVKAENRNFPLPISFNALTWHVPLLQIPGCNLPVLLEDLDYLQVKTA